MYLFTFELMYYFTYCFYLIISNLERTEGNVKANIKFLVAWPSHEES